MKNNFTLIMILAAGFLVACQESPRPPIADAEMNYGAPEVSVAAFGGTLLGYDRGEWGGKLAFRHDSGNVVDVFPENVLAIHQFGDGFVVFTGLGHHSANEGHIYFLKADQESDFRVFSLHKLDGMPFGIFLDSVSGEISFAVLASMDDRRARPSTWIYACRVLGSDYQVRAVSSCAARE